LSQFEQIKSVIRLESFTSVTQPLSGRASQAACWAGTSKQVHRR